MYAHLLQQELLRYWHSRSWIRSIYIRHSGSLVPPMPFLGDYDLVFFVEAKDLFELSTRQKTVESELRRCWLRRFIGLDPIILPATSCAADLCKSYYPFRSVYPFESWRLLGDSKEPSTHSAAQINLPLDHMPENFFYHYLLPVCCGQRQPHPLEPFFSARKVRKDAKLIKCRHKQAPWIGFDQAVSSEIRLWQHFFASLSPVESALPICEVEIDWKFDWTPYLSRWAEWPRLCPGWNDYGVSAWLYPSSLSDTVPYLSLNVGENSTPRQMKELFTAVPKVFGGLPYMLTVGTEVSFWRRLSGLTRLLLFEPWLLASHGVCLSGQSRHKGLLFMPTYEQMRIKIFEFLCYCCYEVFPKFQTNHYTVRLLLASHYFLTTKRISFSKETLSREYSLSFLDATIFDASGHTPLIMSKLPELFRLDLFNHDPHIALP